jgi:tRNA A-37 threonylcarbamoyl transferase component Bud32
VGNSANQQADFTGGRAAPDPRLGTVIDKYTIVRRLGEGGMGTVYEARHATLSRRFAIKLMRARSSDDPRAARRFENEAKLAGALEHPNLVAVIDHGWSADGAPYLVMEFLEGRDCARLLREVGPLPVARAADLVCQACRGLAVVHRARIVHRDLKPENLFVTDAGDGSDRLKVLDFGIAKLDRPEWTSLTGEAVIGTPYYMSPERLSASRHVDGRADVWSLGVVLYQLLSGRRPFEGGTDAEIVTGILNAQPPPLAAVRPDVPAAMVRAVEQAMIKARAERLPDVGALEAALAPFADAGRGATTAVKGTTTRALGHPVGVVPQAGGWRKVAWPLLAVGLLAVLYFALQPWTQRAAAVYTQPARASTPQAAVPAPATPAAGPPAAAVMPATAAPGDAQAGPASETARRGPSGRGTKDQNGQRTLVWPPPLPPRAPFR